MRIRSEEVYEPSANVLGLLAGLLARSDTNAGRTTTLVAPAITDFPHNLLSDCPTVTANRFLGSAVLALGELNCLFKEATPHLRLQTYQNQP